MSDQVAIELSHTANNISLAAAIMAAGALVVTLFQGVLQYISSGESRYKCTKAAIGISSRQTKHSWSLGAWKFKTFYPDLDLSWRSIVAAVLEEDKRGISRSLTLEVESDPTLVTWAAVEANEVPKWGDIW